MSRRKVPDRVLALLTFCTMSFALVPLSRADSRQFGLGLGRVSYDAAYLSNRIEVDFDDDATVTMAYLEIKLEDPAFRAVPFVSLANANIHIEGPAGTLEGDVRLFTLGFDVKLRSAENVPFAVIACIGPRAYRRSGDDPVEDRRLIDGTVTFGRRTAYAWGAGAGIGFEWDDGERFHGWLQVRGDVGDYYQFGLYGGVSWRI